MIIVRSPLRISFVGGGSDLPAYCRDNIGVVVSAAIQHSVYIMVDSRCDDLIRVSYSKTEIVDSPHKIEHDIVRETLLELGIYNLTHGFEIVSMANLPHGYGLGSSGAFTTGLLLALSKYHIKKDVSSEYLYNRSSKIEMERCKKPIGYQDQAASAFGGINVFTFYGEGKIQIDPMWYTSYSHTLESRCLLVDTGLSGPSAGILKDQSINIESDSRVKASIRSMANLALEFSDYLRQGDIDNCGKIMNAAWSLKKSTDKSMSDTEFDNIHNFCMNHGAVGGKLCGAGGRGMMLFICKEDQRDDLAHRILEDLHLRTIKPQFSLEGAKVIMAS